MFCKSKLIAAPAALLIGLSLLLSSAAQASNPFVQPTAPKVHSAGAGAHGSYCQQHPRVARCKKTSNPPAGGGSSASAPAPAAPKPKSSNSFWNSTFNIGPLIMIIQTFGGFILAIAPILITLSYVVCAFLWVSAGSSEKMVRMARSQFVATTISFALIAGYFVFKKLVMLLAGGAFG